MEIFLKTSVALAQHTSGTRCWVTTAAANNISVHQFCWSLTAPLHHNDIIHIFRPFFFFFYYWRQIFWLILSQNGDMLVLPSYLLTERNSILQVKGNGVHSQRGDLLCLTLIRGGYIHQGSSGVEQCLSWTAIIMHVMDVYILMLVWSWEFCRRGSYTRKKFTKLGRQRPPEGGVASFHLHQKSSNAYNFTVSHI